MASASQRPVLRVLRQLLAGLLVLAALAIAAMPWLGTFWPLADFAAALFPVALPLVLLAVVVAARRRLPVVAATVIAVASLVVALRERPVDAPPPRSGAFSLYVVTHNVWARNPDPAGTIDALLRSRADILLLQETDGTIAPYLDRLRPAYPYGSVCRPRCSVAIFSRFPVSRVRYKFRDAAGDPYGPPLVQTVVHPGGGARDFRIVSVHLSRELTGADRAAERSSLARVIQQAGSEDAVVGGDFNLVAWSAGMTTLERDLVPMQRASRGRFSWPARVGGRRTPFPLTPIDHLFAGPVWSVGASQTLPATGSDHYPIGVRLYWKAP